MSKQQPESYAKMKAIHLINGMTQEELNKKKLALFPELVEAVEKAKEARVKTIVDLFTHACFSEEESQQVAQEDKDVIYYSTLVYKAKQLDTT